MGAISRRVGFWFLCAAFMCLGIFLYSSSMISTGTSQNPINYAAKKQNIHKNQQRYKANNRRTHRNKQIQMINHGLWNTSERTQRQNGKRITGFDARGLLELGNDNEQWRQFQNGQQIKERVQLSSWNKSPLKKPSHVADPSIWHQMVKHFPVVLRRFMQPFLPDYKNPCFLEGTQLQCLPYFFLAGAPKCGTSDLWFNIMRHPHVYDQGRKESHFWKEHEKDYTGTEFYLSQFQKFARFVSNKTRMRKTHIVGDGSASTFSVNKGIVSETRTEHQGEIPFIWGDVIHAIYPRAKIIVILRNPTDRTISDYFAFAKSNKLSPDIFHKRVVNKIRQFHRCLDQRSLRTCVNMKERTLPRLHASLYVGHLREWLRIFPRDQMLILRTEDWHYHEDNSLLQDVFEFLDIDAIPESELPLIDSKEAMHYLKWATVSQKGKDKYGDILPQTRILLDEFFEPYNRELASLLNDDGFLWTD